MVGAVTGKGAAVVGMGVGVGADAQPASMAIASKNIAKTKMRFIESSPVSKRICDMIQGLIPIDLYHAAPAQLKDAWGIKLGYLFIYSSLRSRVHFVSFVYDSLMLG